MSSDKTINNFYSIINNTPDNNDGLTDTNNTIYDELKSKEKVYYDTINRTIDYKNKEREKTKYFEYMTINEFIINLFITLNLIMKELISFDYKNFDNQKFMEIFSKDHRLIYTGIFLIIISIFILLIEIADS